MADFSRTAEEFGYDGILVFHNHHDLDPWILAGAIVQSTRRIVPLVAAQPYAYSPVALAKMIRTLVALYQRRIDLNLITGAAPSELSRVGDELSHDERYERATEYMQIVQALLSSDDRLTYSGKHYELRGVQAFSRIDEEDLRPEVFVAGSSPACRTAAQKVGDTLVTHPGPADQYRAETSHLSGPSRAIRVELIARETGEQAWQAAISRYPSTRTGAVQTKFKQRSESDWIRRLATAPEELATPGGVYWTGPFLVGAATCPTLVGSHEQVAGYLDAYLASGVRTIIVAGAFERAEFEHLAPVTRLLRSRQEV
ncbi:LLM class flavin-dependent oxidoreductase [Streptomyces afghaniensis]|uniref:LLM class flavin-dependent oxidoreductase n=1 Tax=Streptomyces afghaniensis TaxID=66865 RepID=UPI001FAF03EF|nr:LLM class flavin-dependent oxidoreductase [Streptomyces sp. HP-A2021]